MKVDTKLVSAGLSEVERMIEQEIGDEMGLQASCLRITIDCIAGAIKADHPRFNVGEFQIDSTPISHERLKQALLTKFGEKS